MNKEFIPYEQALELKELGFDENCFQFYMHSNLLTSNLVHLNHIDQNLFAKAPLYQQAFRWFREKHNWIGGVRSLGSYNENMIIADFKKDEHNSFIIRGETYEDAELKALKYLIERVKNK
jgi:hypothetical protein